MSKLIRLSSLVLDKFFETDVDKPYLWMVSDLGDLSWKIYNIDDDDGLFSIENKILMITESVLRYCNAAKINLNLDFKDEVKPVKNTDLELIKMIIDCISANSFRDILIPINALAEKRGTNIIQLLDEEYSN